MKPYLTLRNDLKSAIFNSVKDSKPWQRAHLGASGIGGECALKLWLSFHWALQPDFAGRILRLFRRGHKEEDLFVMDLREAGYRVETHAEDGKQFRFSELNGHFGGSIDAIILLGDEWFLGEFKTYNKARFSKLTKSVQGVRTTDPVYYIQAQTYMGLSGVHKLIFFAVCKDNDDLHVEEILFNEDVFRETMDKARHIIFESKPPEPISRNPAWFECKWCDFYDLCHKKNFSKVEKNCRTCLHGRAGERKEEAGQWVCGKDKPEVRDFEAQIEGCRSHSHLLPIYLE